MGYYQRALVSDRVKTPCETVFSQVDITMERKYHGASGATFATARNKAHAGNPVLQPLAGEGGRELIFPTDRAFDPPRND